MSIANAFNGVFALMLRFFQVVKEEQAAMEEDEDDYLDYYEIDED